LENTLDNKRLHVSVLTGISKLTAYGLMVTSKGFPLSIPVSFIPNKINKHWARPVKKKLLQFYAVRKLVVPSWVCWMKQFSGCCIRETDIHLEVKSIGLQSYKKHLHYNTRYWLWQNVVITALTRTHFTCPGQCRLSTN